MAQCTSARSNAPAEGLLARARLTVDASAAARTARPEFFAIRWKRSMPRAERRCGYDGCVRSGAEAPRVCPIRRSVPQPPRSLPSAYECWTRTRVQEAQVVEHLVPIASTRRDVCRAAPALAGDPRAATVLVGNLRRRRHVRRRPERSLRARRQRQAPPRSWRSSTSRRTHRAGMGRAACAHIARARTRAACSGGMETSANVCKPPVLAS